LTKENIKARWQASGLWPTNIAKPLINRLLLENSNKAIKLSLGTSENVLALKWNQDGSYIIYVTPQKSKDIRQHIQVITRSRGLDLPICRVLFMKMLKSLDEKYFIIAQHEHQIKQLKARGIELEPRKRRKVRTSPNSKFTSVKAIKKAQIEARNLKIEHKNSDDTINLATTLSYIEIEN
jgi:hypothetical protein